MAITDIADGWVELYDDKNFKDRRLTVRYAQHYNGIPDFKSVRSDDGKRGFGDKTSSARWQMPAGWACILYEDAHFKNSRLLVLAGNGEVAERPNLGDFSDKTSSLNWEPLITDINEAWVELYDDKGFGDRRLTVRYAEHPGGFADLKRVRTDDGTMGFGDKASSAIWRIPSGWRCVLYRHDHFQDPFMVLDGTGFRRESKNFPVEHLTVTGFHPIEDGFEIEFGTAGGVSDQASSLSWTT